MVAYSFKKRFTYAIVTRVKCQTIRAYRKGRSRHARPGDTIQVYSGLRTKQSRLLGYAECQDVLDIRIHLDGFVSFPNSVRPNYYHARLDAFAALDGFRDWRDFCGFWRAEHPGVEHFDGVLIEWGQTFVPSSSPTAGA